jgi:glycosyltransferase involved in cell wall biosynthesis
METSPAKVTVVIAAHNAVEWIEAAIESILTQTFSDFKLLIMDDGSTDDTAVTALQALNADGRGQVIRGPALGVAATRNRAAKHIDSEYIAVMDADDIALPHRLSAQVAHLDAHPEIAILGGWMRIIDRKGNPGKLIKAPRWADIRPRPFQDSFFLAHPTALIRRSAFEELGGYRWGRGVADSDLWARAIDAGFMLDNLQDELVLYRRHVGQMTVARSFENASLMLARDLSRRIRSRGLPDPFDSAPDARISSEAATTLPADLAVEALELDLAHAIADQLRVQRVPFLDVARRAYGLKRQHRSAQQFAGVCIEAAKAEVLVRRWLFAARWIAIAAIIEPRLILVRLWKKFWRQ